MDKAAQEILNQGILGALVVGMAAAGVWLVKWLIGYLNTRDEKLEAFHNKLIDGINSRLDSHGAHSVKMVDAMSTMADAIRQLTDRISALERSKG